MAFNEAAHPSTGAVGDFTVSPQFHTHNHTAPGAIDMAALTALATAESVDKDVLKMVLAHQMDTIKATAENARAAESYQIKADYAKREHELALMDRVLGGLPVVMAAAKELMTSPAETGEVLESLDKVEQDLKIVRKEQADLLGPILESVRKIEWRAG